MNANSDENTILKENSNLEKIRNKKDEFLSFLKKGTKNVFFRSDNNDSASTTIKQYGNIVYHIFADIYKLFYSLLGLLYSYTFGLFSTLKLFKAESKKAAKNHFRIGLEMLKSNNLFDARIRFLMSNMFFNKSPTTKYYIAYTYYLSKDYKKSLKYINQSISIDNKHQRSIDLLKVIEQEMKN